MAWMSADGVAWVRADGMPAIEGVLRGVAASANGLVAVGPGLVLTSVDGRSWTRQSIAGSADLSAVALVGERLLASTGDGSGAVWASVDGTTWAPVEAGGLEGIGGDSPAEWHVAARPGVAVALSQISDTGEPRAMVSVGQ
jgi:hypothetical protein